MRVPILTNEEYTALLTQLTNVPTRNELIVRLMLQCGLRCGEVKNLNTDDVWHGEYTHTAIRITKSSTKSHVGRHVDIPQPVQECIDKYRKELESQGQIYTTPRPLFFSFHSRQRLSTRDIQRITAEITRQALGRSINPHSLRHTYATMLLRYTNIRVVQQLLGHKSLTTTQIYTHPTSQECKKAVDTAFNQ